MVGAKREERDAGLILVGVVLSHVPRRERHSRRGFLHKLDSGVLSMGGANTIGTGALVLSANADKMLADMDRASNAANTKAKKLNAGETRLAGRSIPTTASYSRWSCSH